MKKSMSRSMKAATGVAVLVPVVAAAPANAQQVAELEPMSPTHTVFDDQEGERTVDVTSSRDPRVLAERQSAMRQASISGSVVSLRDVKAVRLAGGSLVVGPGSGEVIDSTEEFWALDGKVVSEQVGVRVLSGAEPVPGGGLGFSLTTYGNACRSTITPAGNKIESCYKKVKSSDADDAKDYWGYHRRATANPLASSQNGRYFVDSVYADSVEAQGPAGNMTRASDLAPVPGDVITSGCSTFNLGVSLPGGVSAGYSPQMCSITKAIDGADWTERTMYGIKYDFGAKTLDRGSPHTVSFSMEASVTQNVTPYWYDFTRGCFNDNFGGFGCTTANQPA